MNYKKKKRTEEKEKRNERKKEAAKEKRKGIYVITSGCGGLLIIAPQRILRGRLIDSHVPNLF